MTAADPFTKPSPPSMDILVSSNLERLLYLASGGDADMVAEKMHQLEQRGWYQIDDDLLQKNTGDLPVRLLR